jgi:hypothetical protein
MQKKEILTLSMKISVHTFHLKSERNSRFPRLAWYIARSIISSIYVNIIFINILGKQLSFILTEMIEELAMFLMGYGNIEKHINLWLGLCCSPQ